MNHLDHLDLIGNGITDGTWADLGSGGGAFTFALAELLPAGSTIFSIDRDRLSLRTQQREMARRYPDVNVEYVQADFTQPLDLPPLDGVLMANSLHFVRDKSAVLAQVRALLKPGGCLILVEYGTDRGNRWVPYPFSFRTWQRLASKAGFSGTRLLAARPSRFLGEIYSALSFA